MAGVLLILGLLLLSTNSQSTDISSSCVADGVKLPVPSIFDQGYSVVSQSQMNSGFRQYLYDRSMSNLISYILTIKPYLIPILVLVGLQLLMLVFVGVRKLVRRRNPPKQPEDYSQIAVVFALLGACLAAAGVIALACLIIIAANGTSNVVSAATCQTNLSVSQFLQGETDKWVGVNNVAGQVSQAALQFNNNVRQLKSGLVGLTVNGSKLGLPLVAPITTMQQLVNAALISDYLFRNTSSNTNKYPICQTAPLLVPNPDGSAVQVRLSYQQTMCDGLTTELNMLKVQARSLDTMNAQLTNLIAASNRSSIVNNLSAMSDSYSSFANTTQISSFDLNPSSSLALLLPYVLAGVSIGLALFVLLVVIARNERLAKAYPLIYVLSFLLTVLSAVVSVWYMTSSAAVYSSCQLYNQALTNPSVYTEFASKFNVSSSLDPVYFCAANPTSTFLNSSQNTASMNAIANLTLLQTNFNSSIPADILTSKSIGYITQLGDYLADLSTVPINGSISIADHINALNQVGDYTYPGSLQTPSCNASRDEFVFNPSKCTRTILDPSIAGENITSQPRCIQIPTNSRTSGSTSTALNMMQHLYVLGAAPCNTITGMFNSANACFLKQRATALFANPACSSVSAQYTSKLKNLVAFSQLAGEYSDAYMQNLRNYLGAYLGVSSNMTSFYLGPNVTKMVSEVATNVTNISKLSNCSYPSQKVTEVKNAFCENVLPSMFQVFVISLGGLACIVLLTVLVHIAEYPLDHIIASSKISIEQHSKIRMDSSMNLEGEVHRNGFDINNLTENEPVAAYQNILMDSSHQRNEEPPLPSGLIDDNNSVRNRSAKIMEVRSVHQQNQENQDRQSVHGESEPRHTPIRIMQKELNSSAKASIKQAKSEFVERGGELLFQFDEDPSSASKDKIKQEEQEQIENVELDEKFEGDPETPVHKDDYETEENDMRDFQKMKPTVDTEDSEVKRIVYTRSAKKIILGTNAKNYLRKLHQRKNNREAQDSSAMQINDFGLMVSHERKRSSDDDDLDPTTIKKLRRSSNQEEEDRFDPADDK